MKARLLFLLLAAALVALGWWSISRRGSPRATPRPRAAKTEVPIQDGKTIDFSTGTAVVSSGAGSDQAIRRSVAQMDAAAATVTFAPPARAAGTPPAVVAPPAKAERK